jgi:putative spermidine/putrescine transport system permease protein
MALPSHASRFDKLVYYGIRVLGGFVLLFLVTPILIIVPLSFNAESFFTLPIKQWSLRWYAEVLGSPTWRFAALNTLFVGICTTTLATVLGTLAALGLHRHNFPFKIVILAVLLSPMVVPLIITAVSIYFFLATLNLVGTFAGLIVGHLLVSVPFVVVTVLSTLAGFDNNLTRAAASMGTGPLRTFVSVTLPIILPGVITGALFAFVTSLDETVISLFIAGPNQQTLPRAMWKTVRENITPEILAVACILTVISAIVLVIIDHLRRRSLRLRGLIN